jgi:hypothetical protein
MIMRSSVRWKFVTTEAATALDQALAALERYGLLLSSDQALPSVVGMIVGEPLRMSWWGHPRGGLIYHTMNAIEDRPEVLSTKLIAGKVTYVHDRLWPAIFAVGTAREPWQLDPLSPSARWLLEFVDREGEVQTNDLPPPPAGRKRVPDLARELECMLLVHATEIHTPSGAHAKVLQNWRTWADSVKLQPQSLSSAAGRLELEEAAKQLAAETPGGVAQLPWQARPSKGR